MVKISGSVRGNRKQLSDALTVFHLRERISEGGATVLVQGRHKRVGPSKAPRRNALGGVQSRHVGQMSPLRL